MLIIENSNNLFYHWNSFLSSITSAVLSELEQNLISKSLFTIKVWIYRNKFEVCAFKFSS